MKRSETIERFMQDVAAAVERGDIAFIESTASREPGVVAIGTDPEGKSVHVRLTSVLLRQEGKWRAVQAHYSIGVPNDHMFDALFRPRLNQEAT